MLASAATLYPCEMSRCHRRNLPAGVSHDRDQQEDHEGRDRAGHLASEQVKSIVCSPACRSPATAGIMSGSRKLSQCPILICVHMPTASAAVTKVVPFRPGSAIPGSGANTAWSTGHTSIAAPSVICQSSRTAFQPRRRSTGRAGPSASVAAAGHSRPRRCAVSRPASSATVMSRSPWISPMQCRLMDIHGHLSYPGRR